jgi:hypothetical protein
LQKRSIATATDFSSAFAAGPGMVGEGWKALMSPGADLGVGKDLLRISSNLPQPLLFSQRQLGGRLIFVIVC